MARPASKENKMEEARKKEEISKQCAAIAEVRAEVNKLSQRVFSLERSVHSGTKVYEKEFIIVNELLMVQLLKLDSIEAEGEAKAQRRSQVHRVQGYIDTLDALKAKNSNPFGDCSNIVSVTTNWETFDYGVGSLTPPSVSSSSSSTKLTQDDEVAKALEKASARYVPIFVLNWVWCDACKYKEILDIIKFQNWDRALGMHAVDYMYPSLLDEFCENFDFEKGTITSRVNGVEFKLDADLISEIFEMPNEGYDKFFKGKFNLRINGVHKDEILVSLNGDKGINHIYHNALSPLNKLLFNLVRRTIVPRTQKRCEANLLDCAIIYCLTNNIQVNFPSLMISHMQHSIPSGLKVGYGTMLTKIFTFFKVPLEGIGKLPLKKEQYIQGSTLHALGLGVYEGKTMSISEIQRLEEEKKKNREEEERKKKEEEKKEGEMKEEKQREENEKKGKEKMSTIKKSWRIYTKSKHEGEIPMVDLGDDDVAQEEVPRSEPKEIEGEEMLLQILKELQFMREKQEDLEGKIFMLRQNVSSLTTISKSGHNEIMKMHKKSAGTSTEDAQEVCWNFN